MEANQGKEKKWREKIDVAKHSSFNHVYVQENFTHNAFNNLLVSYM